jgi:hypothetical protein
VVARPDERREKRKKEKKEKKEGFLASLGMTE